MKSLITFAVACVLLSAGQAGARPDTRIQLPRGSYTVTPKGTEGAVNSAPEAVLQGDKLSAGDFEGWFELQGKAPKGFEGFQGFTLITVDFKSDGTTVPVKPRGDVTARGTFKMRTLAISGANVSFETAAIRGVSYRFVGSLHNGDADDHEARVIEGRLTKSLNGRRLAEAQVKLLYVEGVD